MDFNYKIKIPESFDEKSFLFIKEHFKFDKQKAINWGFFDDYTGLCGVITDGSIIWKSSDLANYIKNTPQIYNNSRELPTFELKSLINNPVGCILEVDSYRGEYAILKDKHNIYTIKQKYIDICRKYNLEIRRADGNSDYVYFVKYKNEYTIQTLACVGLMKGK